MTTTVLVLPPVRRDQRGRRKGRNRWIEYVSDQYQCARQAWFLRAEAFTGGYGVNAEELEEFKRLDPPPQFKDFLVQLAPIWNAGVAA